MGCWTHRSMWLIFIVGLQIGLLTALVSDSTCDSNTEFSCRNDSTICIALSRVRDGRPDCPDKSDEECNEDEFQCQSIHQCIQQERFHDGWPDCDDGSDEECGRGQFRCLCGIPHCIEGSKVKDGTKDCEDGSDEEKSQKKTVRCPEESRLQDLLAVEKKRKKRQIHALGTSTGDGKEEIFDEKVLEIQPSMSGSFSNNFQYSYTKFLNERLSREEYNPKKEVEIPSLEYSNVESSLLQDTQKSLSTKPFMIRTETDQYGSLNSGKIYQTAVNEPISAYPSAESTIMEFDYPKTEKKELKKHNKHVFKNASNLQSRRFSDLMLKIAALFQNNSETSSTTNLEKRKKTYMKNKVFKSPLRRKLLSLVNEDFISQKKQFKRSLGNVKSEISHVPLMLSPTVPYVPQSDVHTTGVVMSTTGTDVINGRTTEWTTIVEGTFIRGTYAHIVHSTSRIYYTVETPTMTTEIINFDLKELESTSSIFESNIHSTPTKSYLDESTKDKKITSKELKSRSQRINDKSLRLLDEHSDEFSTSEMVKDIISPTAVFSTLLDVTTINDESEIDVVGSTTLNSFERALTDLLHDQENNFNLLPESNIKETELKSTRSTDSPSIGNTAFEIISTPTSIAVDNLDKLSPDINKNIDFDDEKTLISDSKLGSVNLIGRMVGHQDSKQHSSYVNSITETNTPKNSSMGKIITDVEIAPSPTSVPHIAKTGKSKESKVTSAENVLKDSLDTPKMLNEFLIKSPTNEFMPLSETLTRINPNDTSFVVSESEQHSSMETSLGVPEVTDLLAMFSHDTSENRETYTITNSEEIIVSTTSHTYNTELSLSSIIHTGTVSTEKIHVSDDGDKVINFTEAYTESLFIPEGKSTVLNFTNNFTEEKSILKDINNSSENVEIHDKENIMLTNLSNLEHIIVNSSITTTVDVSSLDFINVTESQDFNNREKTLVLQTISIISPNVKERDNDTKITNDKNTLNTSSITGSQVMVFLGIASTLDATDASSLIPSIPVSDIVSSNETKEVEIYASKPVNTVETSFTNNEPVEISPISTSGISEEHHNDMSDITVLLLPSMNLEGLKNLMTTSLQSRSLDTKFSETLVITEEQSTAATPGLKDSVLSEHSLESTSEKNSPGLITNLNGGINSEQTENRAKRAVSESVTILRPGGRIVSTDAHIYLTPTTHYTTYTYFTTVIIPGGGSEIRSSLHVDSVILEPTDTAVHVHGETRQHCNECRILNTEIYDGYETRYFDRPLSDDRYHVETVPYDMNRASEITHRTTYTYYTTQFRSGTPYIETRKETKTDVIPLSTGRYSPFEIGTYYDENYPDSLHYHTEAPNIGVIRPDDITHRTTYTYYTTLLNNGAPIVETRKVTDTNATPIPTYYRPGDGATRVIRTSIPTYSQRIDPNLYKPDRVTHRTTYTYHTTRFRDGIPIVNTRKETETNVTPIPTYSRPINRNRPTRHRIVPSRHLPHNYNTAVTETYNPYNRQGTNPYITHRTTYTYYTTKLLGGRTHIDTRYVTETNVTPNPTIPSIRGTTDSYHYHDHHQGNECTVCRDTHRSTANRREPNNRVRGRVVHRSSRRSEGMDPEVLPSTATIYSTYTYATTQLTTAGRPIVRTREHTVTEVLSDVVLPTLKFGDRIRSKRTIKPEESTPKNTVDHIVPIRHTFSRTNSYADGRQGRHLRINDHNRNQNRVNQHRRNQNRLNIRKNEYQQTRNSNGQNMFEIQPTNVTYFSTYTYFTTELSDGKPVVKSREHTVTEILTDVIVPTVTAVRRPLSTHAYSNSLHHRNSRNINSPENHFSFRKLLSLNIIYSDEDLIAAGAEIRRAILPSPVTHYTTYTYYTTKLKPGGNRIIDTSTKVSSSVTYPQSAHVYDRESYIDGQSNKRKLHSKPQHRRRINLHSTPTSQILRTRAPSDILHELGSQEVHRSSNFYRRPALQNYQGRCSHCRNYRENKMFHDVAGSYGRYIPVQKENYLTRIPVRDRNSNARRITHGVSNDINYFNSNIKPTQVTYFSTYTYFTTEPLDGSSIVRSREHTVTEILTDVIVPTVSSLKQTHSTFYADTLHRRPKRHFQRIETSLSDARPVLRQVSISRRKLLSLNDGILKNDSSLIRSTDKNFTIPEYVSDLTKYNVGDTTSNLGKNISLNSNESLAKKILNPNISETIESFQRSEIFSNGTSQLFEIPSKLVKQDNQNLKEVFVGNSGNESELSNKEGVKLADKTNANFSAGINNTLLPNSFNLDGKNETDLLVKIKETKDYLNERVIREKNEDELNISLISSLNSFTINTKLSHFATEKNIHPYPSSAIYFKPDNNVLETISPTLSNIFLQSTTFLENAQTSFHSLSKDTNHDILETPRIGELQLTDLNNFFLSGSSPSTSHKEEHLQSEDLYAEGAEVKEIIIPTPSTHYTTLTYYATILKPGGRREIITNTKVTTSTYYPHVSDTSYYINPQRPNYNRASKIIRHGTSVRGNKVYDLQPERDIIRNQYVHPYSKVNKPYKPSFATNTRIPPYQTILAQRANKNGCISCNYNYHNSNGRYDHKQHKPSFATNTRIPSYRTTVARRANSIGCTSCNSNYYNKRHNRYHHKNYLKSIGERAHQLPITNTNTIPYNPLDIKPTSVTYYSTYTYFTTELQNGSPVIRSRKHTVTEILTDVIVPTITSVPYTRHTKRLNIPDKRYLANDPLEVTYSRRKLLSVEDDSTEIGNEEMKHEGYLKNTGTIDFSPMKDILEENDLVPSISLHNISPTVKFHSATPIAINNNFLGNAQISKAFEAYLSFLESTGIKTDNITLNNSKNLKPQNESDELNFIKPTKQLPETLLQFTADPPKSTTKNMTSVLSTEVKKNGRITKYTTTIYGTYINGVYAQRAKSRSVIIPITEMDIPTQDTTVMFNPSRVPGLVRTIVSRKIRGPIAVHLTTEIHGTFVGGAYAQTARIFTSSQPLSSTRETTRHRIQPYTTTMNQNTRKTGLLSTRVLRSKIDGSKTLLFLSEIYGTHIGGAYAHLGTYTTRTIIRSTSTTVQEETTSTSLPTYYMEDLTTGLVTASVSEKTLNGITTRYHYQVYGTYLDGTYAHVPSISTETLFSPNSSFSLDISVNKTYIELESTVKPHTTTSSLISKAFNTSSKLGLIHASTRAHVINGTTTQHIYEVHGTFLDGNYAHVPSVSVKTILPSKTLEQNKNFHIVTNTKKILPDSEFKVLTIFSDVKSSNKSVEPYDKSASMFFEDSEIEEIDISSRENIPIFDNLVTTSDKFANANTVSTSTTNGLKISDHNDQPTHFFPVLLPEALRLSLSRDFSDHRVKRDDPFSPYLRSSFTSSIKNQQENQHISLMITTPLPASMFSELSIDSLKNFTKSHFTAKNTNSFLSKTKYKCDSTVRNKNAASKTNRNYKNFILKRSKRSPAGIRSMFGTNRRFGVSTSSTRKFAASSSTFKRSTRSKSNTGYRSSSRSTLKPSKSISRSLLISKSLPNFLSRSQRPKITLLSKTPVINPTSTKSVFRLPSTRLRRFGRKESKFSNGEEDFEASEAIHQSITQVKVEPSTTSSARFRRPSKFLKFNARSSTATTASRSNKISPYSSRRSRIRIKSTDPILREQKSTIQDIRSTLSEPVKNTFTKKRFTLTTTFERYLKSTAEFITSLDDNDNGNNLQADDKSKIKRRNKNRSFNGRYRNRQGNSYKPIFDNDDNEVKTEKPKSLPLPVFGRSRGVKRPPKFDPRTIKATTATSTSNIIYLTSSTNETENAMIDDSVDGPITITDVFTTVKTLPVHLGLKTSFATITTTSFTTSVIRTDDLTTVTVGGITKTVLSALTGLPDANLPADKQFTLVTEFLLTTTDIESTSVVAIKVGFGTRTDTIVTKEKMTILATQTNTVFEEKTAIAPYQQQYPYFPNPFIPPLPKQNSEFSLSLSENSFISTQTITSTTVLPVFLNGKTKLTTLTSTSLSEEILVETTTFKVPQQPTMPPFVFPQPVFILPSITTQLTVQFTAHNGEVFSIVTLITVPLALNGHTRFARSIAESYIYPSTPTKISSESTYNVPFDIISSANTFNSDEILNTGTLLQSSFSNNLKESFSNQNTETLFLSSIDDSSKNIDNLSSVFKITDTIKNHMLKIEYLKTLENKVESLDYNDIGFETYQVRKLLQFGGENETIDKIETEKIVSSPMEGELNNIPDTQSSAHIVTEESIYVPDTFHLIGPGFNEDGLSRPIPPVRVVPTRRAYIRRLNPTGPQNRPYEGHDGEFNFRGNNQNFPTNINISPGNDFNRGRPELFTDERFGPRLRPLINQDGPVNNFGTLRNVQYFAPNRPNPTVDLERNIYSQRLPQNYGSNRPSRVQENRPDSGRNPSNFPSIRNNRTPQIDGFDAKRNLPSYTPTRQSVPTDPSKDEVEPNVSQFGEVVRNRVNRLQPTVASTPRRVIRLRRPGNPQQARTQSGRELLDRKPIVNALTGEKQPAIRARGPVVPTNAARDVEKKNDEENSDTTEYSKPLPLTYYTTFTYMTTFLNGPSTAYSTREAVVSNIATETLNPKLVGLIRSRGGFTTLNGAQTAVPLGSRAQGATTTIVNLASRIQLYNSDVYYGRLSKPSDASTNEDFIKPTLTSLQTIPITDVASLPKTYYTLFTYYYTLRDGDKSTHSQRSETISSVDTQTEPFILQDFASTIDNTGLLTLKPNKQIVNLGLRTAGGTTTEVNLELKTVVHFDNLKNVIIDRGRMTPTLVEVIPSKTNSIFNNYLDPDDAEVQDQQTYPQTVPIQPSFSSANEVYVGTQRSPSNKEATPEIPLGNRIIRTQSIRGPLRIASTILQRPGTLRSGVFAPRPGVRVRVRPVSSRITSSDKENVRSFRPNINSFRGFDSSRSIVDVSNDFDEDDDVTEEDESTTEEIKSTENDRNQRSQTSGRKRLKITIRRSPGVSASKTNSGFIRPTRTRPRFYVVTRTASPAGGQGRQSKRPVSVKVSRRPRPSADSEYETYTTVTSVPVVFGLSTTYRNAIVTSSSLVAPEIVTTETVAPEASKTVILTYFTTTTYTVPYTVDGVATYTTLEETNSRIATETLDPNADLSFISTTTLDYGDEISVSSADLVKQPPQTLQPQLVNNQLNVGPRINLATKVSNGVTLIVATDGEAEATHVVSQPAMTLRPTVVTDALLMTNKDITTVYEPRTFYTTFTFFTTFFSGSTPSISTSEQVITNVYSVPVTHSITRTHPATEPITVIETSENLVSKTLYTTHTFYATLFNGTGTIVTPIEELQSSVISSTETYTITKTIMPSPTIFLPEIKTTETQPVSITTTSLYKTRTNFVTLFRGSESIVSPLEEIETDVVTLTLDDPLDKSSLKPIESYTTRTIQATNTHYITLFSGSESILSSITEVAPSVITELVKQLQVPTTTSFVESVTIDPTATISSSSSIEPTFQDLVPSIRTQYTTLTYFTTLFTDSSTILSSREEVATSYITLFVPAPLPGTTSTENVYVYPSKTDLPTHNLASKPNLKDSSVTPTSVLTFYTTYTYYTTLFRGTETIISDSETVVTQYVTIESTPTDTVSEYTTSLPPTFSRPNSESFEVKTEPSSTIISSSTFGSDSYDSSNKDSSANDFEEDLKIIGVSTKVESGSETPSVLTGIPTTDSNGATHILFTDFIVPTSIEDSPTLSTEILSKYVTPSLPDFVSSPTISELSSILFDETKFSSQDSSTPSSARDSASDLATTRLTDVNVATHHMVLRPTSSYNSGSSQTLGIKPGAVIDLSDVLTNTNLVGNLGETIKDIVNLFAANGNRAKNISSKVSTSTSDSSVVPPSGGITVSSAEDPVYIPIGAIARSTKISTSPAESEVTSSIIQPSIILSGFTPIMKSGNDIDNRKVDSSSLDETTSDTLTSIVFGSNTIFIQPTNVITEVPATILFSDMDGRFHSSFDTKIQGSVSNTDSNQQKATPGIKYSENTSIISGHETIFFGFPDVRQPPEATTQIIQGSASTSSVVGYETIFFDSPGNFFIPGSNQVNITGATTIFGTYPAITEPSSSANSTPDSTFTTTSSGETTIFFPVPGDNQHQNPGTRYVTSVESVTLTLTLTTSSVYQTEDTPVTVTSVFTTTIPPRTFVSTIIGDRTILGTQPEPTEAVQVIPTMQPSESTTTVTTTTLIFNSIATTVVRTLVIPTNAIQPTKASTSAATETVNLAGIGMRPKERPRVTTQRTTPRKPIQLFKSGSRPTEPTTAKPVRTGPPLKLFPTRPPTTTPRPTRPTTTRKNTFRKPGKTLVPITDGCVRECNLKNKEVCKQNPDRTWSCQCRPGFFKKNGSEECKDIKSYVVLVRVLKMGDDDVTYSPRLSNHLSPEYKNLTTTARKAVDDAYKTSNVADDFVSTNVLSVSRDSGVRREGVLVNLTVQLSGEKPANEAVLREELEQSLQSLEAAASEISLANASVVSPIIQRVEDVQDFDECYDDSYNDCSRSSVCVNLPGTYTCECKDGYQDLEPLLPGRICSGEIKDCDYCNNRGVCIMTEDDNKFCRCYRMYLGRQCEINGLVLAIALPIALALLILTMFCLLCGCRKLRQRRAQKPKPNVFKGMAPPLAGTLDRKAMIMDSSSESSGEHRPPAHPAHAYDGFGDDVANSTMKRSRRSEPMDDHMSEFQVPTVLIPRAKHSHPKQVNAPYPNYRMPHHRDMDGW